MPYTPVGESAAANTVQRAIGHGKTGVPLPLNPIALRVKRVGFRRMQLQNLVLWDHCLLVFVDRAVAPT